ncbi:MAG: response regulator, partial [Candidatus Heimdallarchaeota archaeon]|nr:response regulator [Candidatus Heimdallarchaeota archaeon]
MAMRKLILLAEDNPDDVLLTQRAFKKSNIANVLIVVKDGQETLDYLFAEGKYEGRDTSIMPEVILLDIKMPKMDGLEVLKVIREDLRTKHLPVVILT